MKHALVKLARAIDWRFLEETFGPVYTTADGRAADPQAHLQPFRRGSVRSLGGEIRSSSTSVQEFFRHTVLGLEPLDRQTNE